MKKVFVGLSGGVDSAVSAAILKKEGYRVTGIYMKNWSGDQYGLQADCPWEQDQKDAEKICGHLGIEFRSFNFEKSYREKVVEYFFSEYEAGRTPNPDVMCNKEIKFKLFLDKALEEGADLIATGHYVRKIEKGERVQNDQDNFESIDHHKLLKGIDNTKDQSYFLYNITQEQLSRSLFPVGGYEKSNVREIARKFRLPNAEKPDSQGICFIGEINVREFIKQRLGEKFGPIIDIDTQRQVGEHDGAHFYTIGQREGLKIGGTPEPYFVVGTDIESNTVFVGMSKDHSKLFRKELELENLHLISGDSGIKIQEFKGLTAAVRYRQTPQPGKLGLNSSGKYIFTFDEPQRAVTAGQSLVIYDGVECLGGGVIK